MWADESRNTNWWGNFGARWLSPQHEHLFVFTLWTSQCVSRPESLLLTIGPVLNLLPYDVSATMHSFFLWSRSEDRTMMFSAFRWCVNAICNAPCSHTEGKRSAQDCHSPRSLQVKCIINDAARRHQTHSQPWKQGSRALYHKHRDISASESRICWKHTGSYVFVFVSVSVSSSLFLSLRDGWLWFYLPSKWAIMLE